MESEVRGRILGSSGLPGLRWVGEQGKEGASEQAGAVSCRAPEPSQVLPQVGSRSWGRGEFPSHPCLCNLIAAAVCLGWSLRDLAPTTWAAWGLAGRWVPAPSVMTAGQSLGTWPWEGAANWVLPPLSWAWTWEGESCALGPYPFLSGQRITFVWWRFTETSLPDHSLTSRTKDLIPRCWQEQPCPSFLSPRKGLYWELLGSLGLFLKENFVDLFCFSCSGSSLLCGLSLVVASRGVLNLRCSGFSLRWLLLLWSTGSRVHGLQ